MTARQQRAKLFYDSMNPLLTYANEQLGLSRRKYISMSTRDRDALRDGSCVLDALWENMQLIDEFVELNPYGMPEQVLDTVRPWRYAIGGEFACVDAQEGHALYLAGGRLFCVRPLLRDANACIRNVPCVVCLVLLPFCGRIVTDSRIIHMSDNMDDEETRAMVRGLRCATNHDIVETDTDLIAFRREAARSQGTAA